MSSILLEPIIPNLTKVGGSGEQLRDLWKLFTKVKDCTQGGRRLENLYWRLWYQSSSTGQLKESGKISSLFESWRGPGEDFKSRSGSMTSGDHDEPKSPCDPMDPIVTAVNIPPAAPNSVFAPPPPTPSIQISRVSSALKEMAAAAAAAAPAPAPAVELNAPAVPVNIQAKKNLPDSNSSSNKVLTPSKLSVGFFSEAKATTAPGATAAVPLPKQVTSTLPPPSTQLVESTIRPRASTADFACAPRAAVTSTTTTRKKFFINSLSSVSSEESLDEIMSNCQQSPVNPASSANPAPPQSSNHSFFSKVAPPEQPPPPEVPPKERPTSASNLSNLLKNPRRPPARNANILTTSQYFTRRRDADTSPQYFESESLRRALQIDRKPWIDPSLVHLGGTPMTYTELPAAW